MAYYVRLSEKEQASLAWCAARYESARILHDGMANDGDAPEDVFRVPEHVVWASIEAITQDGGAAYEDGGFIPCLDSPAIRAMFDRVV